ncbi:TetR/AcrR family transcriptional regulator [Chitinophaga sp. Mgbs1]|uniref:TetR/AcrR family transcriptional regulator n=1 Tax=Chitinophaga solisilvae TaxID=1233460 RepID=A0A3S1D3I4_9BACT|nr:TetR/AcrR family transcriptional regulator [Chitinophaga solisilvae]
MARLKEFNPEERLEKAKQLFWAKGYNATSMKDIVTVMKLNPGSIYSTFGGKQELFMECLKKYAGERLSAFRQEAGGEGSPLQVLEQVIREGASVLIREGKGCMTVRTMLELGKKNKQAHTVVTSQVKSIIDIFEALLVKAQEAGEVHAHREPREMAMFLYAGFNGVWQMDILLNDKRYVNSVIDQLIDSVRR